MRTYEAIIKVIKVLWHAGTSKEKEKLFNDFISIFLTLGQCVLRDMRAMIEGLGS